MKQVLIWLEDLPNLNNQFKELFTDDKFDLVICKSLTQFKEAIDKYIGKEQTIAGFVIDILIPAPNLGELGLPFIETNEGNDTGFLVLSDYLRNWDDESPNGNAFLNHKVLILTTLGNDFMDSRYLSFKNWDKETNPGLTKWQPKSDDDGNYDKNLIDEVKAWIDQLI